MYTGCDDERELLDSTRWQTTLIPFDDGRQHIFLDNIYGITGPTEEAKYQNSRLFPAAFRVVNARGTRVPQIICTDTNTDPTTHPIIVQAMEQYGWVEAAHLQKLYDGKAVEYTYFLNSDFTDTGKSLS